MSADSMHIEREFLLETALKLGLKEIEKFPFDFELITFGKSYAASVGRFKTSAGKVVIEACGKGNALNSRVGAIYEIIQDYFASSIDNSLFSLQAKISYASSKYIAEQSSIQPDLVINILKTLPDYQMPYRNYQNISGDKTMMVPTFLSNVNIPEDNKTIAKYASDNGHAAGLNIAEALLHSINEYNAPRNLDHTNKKI